MSDLTGMPKKPHEDDRRVPIVADLDQVIIRNTLTPDPVGDRCKIGWYRYCHPAVRTTAWSAIPPVQEGLIIIIIILIIIILFLVNVRSFPSQSVKKINLPSLCTRFSSSIKSISQSSS